MATVPVWHSRARGYQGFRAESQVFDPIRHVAARWRLADITHGRQEDMNTARTIGISAVVAVAGATLALAAAGSATARPEPAPTPPSVQSERLGECPLARVGTQFVRCDDLTGAGVPAPSWIPEQR